MFGFGDLAHYYCIFCCIMREKLPLFKYKRLKLKLRVFLAGHSVAMVTDYVTEILSTCSPVIGQFCDTMIVVATDKEW